MTRQNLSLTCHRPKAAPWRHAGFTLIEVMVAMTIGLMLVLAMVTLLTNVTRNNSELSKTNRLIENGRFALQLLENDISHAGFWGGYVPSFDNLTMPSDDEDDPYTPTDYPTRVPDPCPSESDWNDLDLRSELITNLIGIPVQGYEIAKPLPSPVLPVCASRVTRPQPGTDVLFVRHLERAPNCNPAIVDPAGINHCPAPTDGELYFQQSRCGVNTIPDPAGEPPYVLGAYDESNARVPFSLTNRDCTTPAELRKFVANLYYIRTHAVEPGDGIPALMRSEFGPVTVGGITTWQYGIPQVMIEGVESFQVEYGIDNVSDNDNAVDFSQPIIWFNPDRPTSPTNRGDGIPDGGYVRCTAAVPCTVDQLANVVAVRIHVLVRNVDPTPGYIDNKTYNMGATTFTPARNDPYKRHLFTQTIRLHNVSTRRETP